MSISLNILKLLSGRIAVQALSFITVPIITRLFLPEHFGVIQIFDSISKILSVTICLKYELSIPLARNDQEVLAGLTLTSCIILLLTMLITAVVAIGKGYLAAWFKAPELETFLWLLPVVVFASGLKNGLGTWAAREGQFGAIAWSQVGQSLAERVIPILWGTCIRRSSTGLFVGRVIGAGIGIWMLFVFLRKKLITMIQKTTFSFETLWIVMKRHKKFAIFTIWGSFFTTLSRQLPIFFFSAYYPKAIVGYYSLAYKVIIFPMTMLRLSISKVFLPVAAKEYNERGTLTDIVSKLYTRLLQIAVFPMTAVTFFGPMLFIILFSQHWYEAGIYAQMIAIWSCIIFVNAPLQVFFIVNRQEVNFLMNILTVAGTTIGLLIGVTFAPPVVTLGIFVIINVCFLLGQLAWKLKLAPVSLSWALKTMARYVILSCMFLIPAKLVAWVIGDFRFILIVLGLSTLGYEIILLKTDRTIKEFILEKLNKQH